MDLNQLRTFRLVATTLSFTQAAHLLDYAQSSVSAQIRALEDELRAPLFDRIGRRVALTAAGRRMLDYAERMLALEAEARDALAGDAGLAQVVRLGAPESLMTYWLPPVLRRCREVLPHVQLAFQPMVDIDLFRAVTLGQLDLAVLLQPPVRVGSLAVERLRDEPLWVIAPADHALARRRRVAPSDLAGETVFLTENGCGYRHLFEQELAREGNYACARLEFGSVEAIKRCVAAGLGVGFLPALAVGEAVARGELVALRWEKKFSVQAQMIWHRQKWLSPAERRIVELCQASASNAARQPAV